MYASNKLYDATNQSILQYNKQTTTQKQQAGVSECNVPEDNIFIKEVPGAYELPYAAKLLAISETTLRRMIKTGEIPIIQLGERTLLLETDLEDFLMSNYGTMTPPPKRMKNKRPPLPTDIKESPFLRNMLRSNC